MAAAEAEAKVEEETEAVAVAVAATVVVAMAVATVAACAAAVTLWRRPGRGWPRSVGHQPLLAPALWRSAVSPCVSLVFREPGTSIWYSSGFSGFGRQL